MIARPTRFFISPVLPLLDRGDWRERFREKEISAADAIRRHVKPVDRISIDSAYAVPRALLAELIAQRNNLKDLEIIHFLTVGGEYLFTILE